MNLSVELFFDQARTSWLVNACGMHFKFPDEASAKSFAAKLEERLRAPHALPRETQLYWAAEHVRILRNA